MVLSGCACSGTIKERPQLFGLKIPLPATLRTNPSPQPAINKTTFIWLALQTSINFWVDLTLSSLFVIRLRNVYLSASRLI